MLSLAWWREVNVEQVDAVVIGAGVVGLAVGRALALSGREVLVLESENAIGTGTSSRNSEVIHAGIYYPAGSLKARLCVQGKQMLYAYCAERGVAHKQLGKLIVATSREQRRVGSVLDDRPVMEDDDAVEVGKCRQAMRDHHHGLVLHQGTQAVLDVPLGDRIERAGRLVEQQDRRVLEDSPRECDALPLAA